MIQSVDRLVNDPRFMPYWGWHDDHRERDRTPGYLPALQQVRSEYAELLDTLMLYGVLCMEGSALQIGMGAQDCSHRALGLFFRNVLTIDEKLCAWNDARFHGLNSQLQSSVQIAKIKGPFQFLLIDAGHKARDVEEDFVNYAPLVCRSAIIAVHDALKRPGYEDEVEVWRWLADGGGRRVPWRIIGQEVGFAWTIKS